ncbi:kinase-like domain-containing protein [Dendryphion nanum]|uniref:Kinase-like domain-containing protein n=1 Tax=Dendryphion nanum TaxID=256645 RepID=A0A9P9DP42_9PLEO|nr:kinase-like domain-containing protein [Dendryphion nanum]
MSGMLVAHLGVQLADRAPNDTPHYIEIRASEQFYLGRNPDLCRHIWPDPAISNRHLQIHCIIYESDHIYETPPFVYATDLSTNGTFIKKHNVECSSPQSKAIRMGRKNGAFLLDDGDELRLSNSVTLIFRSHIPQRSADMTLIQRHEKNLFSSKYLFTGRVLGIGSYGKVVVAIHQKTQRQAACKIIDLTQQYNCQQMPSYLSHESMKWPSRVARCFREFDILKDLNHPNIIALKKVFWSSNTIYIFQELVTGGDLFSYIDFKKSKISDVQSVVILRQVLKGLQYLHDHNIVHRDLKPDNILMTSMDDGARIVITDFGTARFLPENQGASQDNNPHKQRMFSLAGTLEYAAPEIHKQNEYIFADHGYSKSVDMWSVGALAALLVSGDNIFNGRFHPRYKIDPQSVIMALASRCDLSPLDDPTNQTWKKVGPRPKEFIKGLLRLREEERMTVTEALNHPWLYHSSYADELDALYQRSIRHWQPRLRVFKLVEPIPNVAADLESISIPEEILSQDVVSNFFASPIRVPSSPIGVDENNTMRLNGRQIGSLSPITDDQEEHYVEDTTHHLLRSRVCHLSSSLPRQHTFESAGVSLHASHQAAQLCSFTQLGKRHHYQGFYMDGNESITGKDDAPQTPRKSSASVLVLETPSVNMKWRYGSPVAANTETKAPSQKSDGNHSELDLNSSQYFTKGSSKKRKSSHLIE